MEQQVEFILQTFNGKAYTEEARGPRKVVEALFERMRGSRRIVLASKERDPVPKYRKPPRASINAGRSIQGTTQAYLAWAQRNNVPSVTFYDDNLGKGYARTCGKPVKFVNPTDFLGDAPEPEAE